MSALVVDKASGLFRAMYCPQFLPYIIAVLLALTFIAVKTFVKQRQLSRLARSYGCVEAKSRYPSAPFTFGLGYLIRFIPHIRRHRFAEKTLELHNDLGTTFVHTVAGQHMVHTIDPENLKALLLTNSRDYNVIPARATLTRTIYGDGIFARNSHESTKSRALVRQALVAMSYGTITFERHADAMIQDLRSSGSSTVNFADIAWQFTTDLTLELYFGESSRSVSALEAERSARLIASFKYLGQVGRSVTLFGRRIPLALALFHHGWKKEKLALESILDAHLQAAKDRIRKPVVDSEEKGPKTYKTLVQSMAETTDDMTRAKAEIMNLLLAGGDTTAIAISEVTWLLSRHPLAWQKLRAEVQTVTKGEKVSLQDLKKMEYLKAIIDETIRLRPTLSVHGRYSNTHTTLPRGGGPTGTEPILVPAGSYVLYSNYALRRNPAVFGPDVDTFRPERWLGPDRIKVDHWEFLPFGGGARACPGEKLGFMITAYALARLAAEFETFRAMDERAWEEEMAFSYFNKWGCLVRFE